MPYRADKDAAQERVRCAQRELEAANKALAHWYPPKPLRWWQRAWLFVTRPFRRRQAPSFSDRLQELMQDEVWVHGASPGFLRAVHAQLGMDDGKIRPPQSPTASWRTVSTHAAEGDTNEVRYTIEKLHITKIQ